MATNDVVEQFGRMVYHTTHHSNIIYVDCTMATSTSSTVPIYLSTEIQQIVYVGNLNGHFVLIHIKLHQIEVIIYDGIGSIPLHHWNPHDQSFHLICDMPILKFFTIP